MENFSFLQSVDIILVFPNISCICVIIRTIKSRRMQWTGHLVHMREKGSVYTVLVGRLEGMRALGRPRCRWDDLREIRWCGLESSC
jgi:hypothetical protein